MLETYLSLRSLEAKAAFVRHERPMDLVVWGGFDARAISFFLGMGLLVAGALVLQMSPPGRSML